MDVLNTLSVLKCNLGQKRLPSTSTGLCTFLNNTLLYHSKAKRQDERELKLLFTNDKVGQYSPNFAVDCVGFSQLEDLFVERNTHTHFIFTFRHTHLKNWSLP